MSEETQEEELITAINTLAGPKNTLSDEETEKDDEKKIKGEPKGFKYILSFYK